MMLSLKNLMLFIFKKSGKQLSFDLSNCHSQKVYKCLVFAEQNIKLNNMSIFAELPHDLSKNIYAIALKQRHDEALEKLSMDIDAIISGDIQNDDDCPIKIYERTQDDKLYRDVLIKFNGELFHLDLYVFKESDDFYTAILWIKPSENNMKSPESRQVITCIVEKMINIGKWSEEWAQENMSADEEIEYYFGDENNCLHFKAAIEINTNKFGTQFGHWETNETFRASEDIIDKYKHMLEFAFMGEEMLD